MTVDEKRQRIREIIAEMATLPIRRIDGPMALTADIGLDSLQLYELAAALEDEFGLPELGEDEVGTIETVADVERRVLELLAVETDR